MIAHADVVIIGGGPVGATLALSLRETELSVVILEAQREAQSDKRTLALSYNSRLILERLGVWQKLARFTPIENVHVSQRGAFGSVQLRAEEIELPALGYTLDYSELRRALASAIAESPIEVVRGAEVVSRESISHYAAARFRFNDLEHVMTANLLAIADGGASETKHDYLERAIVTEVRTESAPATTAFERFRANGTIALLPKPDRWALIWSAPFKTVERLLAASDEDFLREFELYFGERLGRFDEVGPRNSFPLIARVSPAIVGPRMVWLGNAAQTLHPVMAQGLNLGLRDAFALALETAATQKENIGSERMLANYRARRARDRRAAMLITDSLARLFALDASRFATTVGFNALNSFSFARKFFVRRAIFGS
ncbi:MAG: FAD-dependent monooxygenase [Burkholderiales bacterium]